MIVKSEDMATSIGYEKDSIGKIKRWQRIATADFQVGINPGAYISYVRKHHSLLGYLVFAIILPISYLQAQFRTSYAPPSPEFEEKLARSREVEEKSMTLSEIGEKFEIEFDVESFGVAGKTIFSVEEENVQ